MCSKFENNTCKEATNYVKRVNPDLFNILCVDFYSYVWIGKGEVFEVKTPLKLE